MDIGISRGWQLFTGSMRLQIRNERRLLEAHKFILRMYREDYCSFWGRVSLSFSRIQTLACLSREALSAKEAFASLPNKEEKLLVTMREALSRLTSKNSSFHQSRRRRIIADFNTLLPMVPESQRPMGKVLGCTGQGYFVYNRDPSLSYQRRSLHLEKIPLKVRRWSKSHPPLKVLPIKEIFQYCYNSAAPMLELMHHLSSQGKSSSLNEAFRTFRPDGNRMVHKYHGGDCVSISIAIVQMLRDRGFTAGIVGVDLNNDQQKIFAPWLELFFSDNDQPRRINFEHFRRTIDHATHCAAVLYGGQKELVFDYLGYNRFDVFFPNGSFYDKQTDSMVGRIFRDHEELIKNHLRGKIKGVIVCDDYIFGYDLVRNNIYLNWRASVEFNKIPKKNGDRFSLNLDDLKTPEEQALYTIEGRSVKMSHLEVLHSLYKNGKYYFNFPPDFIDNILLLARHKEAVIAEILLPKHGELVAIAPLAMKLGRIHHSIRWWIDGWSLYPHHPIEIPAMKASLEEMASDLNNDLLDFSWSDEVGQGERMLKKLDERLRKVVAQMKEIAERWSPPLLHPPLPRCAFVEIEEMRD